MSKIKLDKYETALVLASKGWGVNLKYKYDESYEFIDNQKIFNTTWYRKIAYVYADWCSIPIETVRIEHVISTLYELLEKVQPHKIKSLMRDIIYSVGKESKNDLLFTKLYGYISGIQMKTGYKNENIYDLDEELIIRKDK